MTWTYNVAQLATSELYQVRLEIQDTDSTNELLQDEEIDRALSVESNFWGAAARCCEILARRFLAKADVRLGRALAVTYSKMAEQYAAMATSLRGKAIAGTAAPWVGGMLVSDKEMYREQTNLVQPIFARDMQENPWAGGYTSDIGSTEGGDPGDGDGD